MSRQQKEKQIYNGLQVDSQEEVMFLQWAKELQDKGYIQRIDRASSIELSMAYGTRYIQTTVLKTKVKEIEKVETYIKGHVYTPEFLIELTEAGMKLLVFQVSGHLVKNEKIFISTIRKPVIYIEVKPIWDQQNMERLFKINQKWVMDKHGIFINLVKPVELFEKTFTPVEYTKTATGKDRKINWKVRTIDEWLNTQ